MNRSLAPAAVLLVALTAPASLIAQNAPAAQPLPKDPVALLQLASQVNGLHGDDLQPWHLHATWETQNQKGQPIEQGTLEEWWAGKNSAKVTMSSAGFQQTRWVTAQGEFASGNQGWPSWVFRALYEMIQNPVLAEKSSEKMALTRRKEKQRAIVMDCTESKLRESARLRKYCFSDELPVVRLKATAATETVFNSIVRFQGRYLARQMHMLRIDMPGVEFRVDQLEDAPALRPEDLQPSSDAVRSSYWITHAATGIEAGNKIGGQQPIYLAEAKARRIQGSVEIAAIIGKDGSLGDLEVIGGLQLLRTSTMDAVRTWRYKPYLLDGQPTDVPTEIAITYSLR